MSSILTDVAHLAASHKKELLRGERVQAELDILEQHRLKEAADLLESRHIEGIGQKILTITPNMAARLRLRFGQSCLHDKDFLKSLLKKNPFLRVKCAPAKFALLVNGFRKVRHERDAGHGAQGDPATPFGRGSETPRHLSGHHATRSGVSLVEQR